MKKWWVLATIVCLCAPAALADTPKVEIGAGYAFLRDQELKESFSLGWVASVAGNLNDWLGVVGEVGGNYGKVVHFDVSVHSFMGGLRFSSRRGASAVPFFQALAGVARSGIDLPRGSESSTDFAIQPGIGVDIEASEKLAFRIGGDYRLIFSEGDKASQFRIHVGIVFRSGHR